MATTKRSYSSFRNDIAANCAVSTSNTAAMAIIDKNLNDSINTVCNLQGGKLRFLESTKNMYTVAGQETYQIPNGFRKLIDHYIYSGSGSSNDTIYSPEMVFDPTKWKRILQYRLGSGSVPYFVYVQNQTYKIQPIPDTDGNLIVLRGRLQIRNLSIADYATGSIVSIANGGTSVVGTGTSWTADMAGRFINITETTAANGGDGFDYEIASVQSATTLTLVKPYEGTSISAGTAAYTIGQCSVIPQAYDVAAVYRATALYWQKEGTADGLSRAKTYWMMYDGGMEAGYRNDYGGLIQQMLDNEGETEEGAYIPPYGSQSNTILTAPYYFPYQLASGFN
jgi:hypothetical protein